VTTNQTSIESGNRTLSFDRKGLAKQDSGEARGNQAMAAWHC
jgi:hypothetical protein